MPEPEGPPSHFDETTLSQDAPVHPPELPVGPGQTENTASMQPAGVEESQSRTQIPVTSPETPGMPGFEATPGDPIETAQDIGGIAALESHPVAPATGETPEIVTPGSVMPSPEMTEDEWRAKNWPNAEPDANRAHYAAAAEKPLYEASLAAEQVGRPEKAEELRAKADVQAQEGAKEFDKNQRRETERQVIEARKQENARRAQEERRQRLETEVNALVDKVFEAVELPVGEKAEIFDDMEWAEGYGNEPTLAAFYERLGLTRPEEASTPARSYDRSEGGSAVIIGSKQVENFKAWEIPTPFGVTVVETRYKPGHQYDLNGPRVRLTVEKAPEQAEQPA
jgi:hypothetical protein